MENKFIESTRLRKLIQFILISVLIVVTNCDTHLKHFKLSHRDKIQLAKKVGAALLIAVKNKRLMIPLPLPLPLPIPIFKTYQTVIHDPLLFKHQAIKHIIGKHLG